MSDRLTADSGRKWLLGARLNSTRPNSAHGGRPPSTSGHNAGVQGAGSGNAQQSAAQRTNNQSGTGTGSHNATDDSSPRNAIPQSGYLYMFTNRRIWRFRLGQVPFIYRPASVTFTSLRSYRLRDALRRVQHLAMSERTIDPFEGRVCSITIQATSSILSEASYESTWDHTFITSGCGIHVRLSFWAFNYHQHGAQRYVIIAVRHLIASTLLAPLLILPFNAEGEPRNYGRYDAFPYKLYTYSKIARNQLESKAASEQPKSNPSKYRTLGPSRLLDIKTDTLWSVQLDEQTTMPATKNVIKGKIPPYLFVSWTAVQFPNMTDTSCDIFRDVIKREAQKYNLDYYWISSRCIVEDIETEVWSLSDIIRGAARVVIIVNNVPEDESPKSSEQSGKEQSEKERSEKEQSEKEQSEKEQSEKEQSEKEQSEKEQSEKEQSEKEQSKKEQSENWMIPSLLKEWGNQIWTLPEVLLCNQNTFMVYKVNDQGMITGSSPYTRYQLAKEAWKDSSRVRQLVDHFENNLALSRLEMSTIALECLYDREYRRYLPGDRAYALMGLARIRPTVNKGDNEFQAFARISLANDNDLLLERAICMLPKKACQKWHKLEDAYDAQLWDIYPDCQVAGVGGSNDMVLINNEEFLGYGDSIYVKCEKIRRFDPSKNVDRDFVDSLNTAEYQVLIPDDAQMEFPDGIVIERDKEITIQDNTTIDYVEATMTKDGKDIHPYTLDTNELRLTNKLDSLTFGDVKPVRIGSLMIMKGDTIFVKRNPPALVGKEKQGKENDKGFVPIKVTENPKIIEDYTVLVDGARGAAVKWDGFAPVYVRRPWSWIHAFLKTSLHVSIICLIIGAALLYLYNWIKDQENLVANELTSLISPSSVTSAATLVRRQTLTDNPTTVTNTAPEPSLSPNPTQLADQSQRFIEMLVDMIIHPEVIRDFGIVLVLLAVFVIVLSPSIIYYLYGGMFTGAQPWLFGLEGYLPIEEIETLIFGDYCGRLRWHPYGSPLSRHKEGDANECIALDPSTDEDVKQLIENAKSSRADEMKIFTLVDTYTNTVTLFQALRPPVVFLLLGREGGMQRAVGCSYDWAKGTLVRETVLRMETAVREKMDGVPRLKLNLKTSMPPTKPSGTTKASSSAPSGAEKC